MSEKIYEYKDDKNWFIGKWQGYNTIKRLGHGISQDLDSLSSRLSQFNTNDIEDNWESFGYDVVIVTKDQESDVELVAFVLDMINQECHRHLRVTHFQGAHLIVEDDKLYDIFLPKSGISADAFQEDNKLMWDDTILIATHNKGKTKEFAELFGQLGYKVQDLNDFPDLPEVEETGITFEENARLKAETISNLTGKMVIADDSGLKVDVLGGLPGVWSARFSGPEANDDKNNAKLLHELAMVFDQKARSAQFHSTLVVAAPEKESLVVEADWPGYIAFQPKGDNGFGYDPLFIVGETGKHAAELLPEEKNQISHRGLAFKKLMEVFPEWQRKQQ
ncbi:deoxyribonucleotide triphosphate pyrophosphatase [Streptococcus uberis 6780]|uniref:nucleoside-triphosphate diphosphatase n=1 Tax=Streptococcus uberis TaxID=1349 RepID=UPI00062039B5|nr:nucleoside-triphosphate diphosphatase [Streptococcus uberis]KKF56756.1 deoxyribonucleotide triphosphate pyrophosphatase [Streptococcus uberis 6780]MCK1197388.1 nucleoside-triphosphate diphosphatase [Streptococcus uberis]